MQGLHLTGDLFDCGCAVGLLTDQQTLAVLCRDATIAAGLTIVDEKYHRFPDWNGEAGGVTGAVLLAESHLAVHTWPERRGVTLDVYVCNFSADNSDKAEQLFDTLLMAFRPQQHVVNRIQRGDLAHNGAPAAETFSAPLIAPDGVAPRAQAEPLIFDWLNAHSGYGLTARKLLETIDSPYQRIEVYDTQQFGKLFRLDGRLMTSEGEEFFYHECMTHPAFLTHANPQSVLVIGGGDGGSSEEIFKHPSVKRIVMAELDSAVIDVARTHLGSIHKGVLDDPRLEIVIGDGFDYVQRCQQKFDLIVLDLTDPDTPAFRLYSEEFFRLCQRILNPGGALTLHLGSPVYQPDTVKKNAANLRKVFKHVQPMSLFIPLYGSLWCLAFASDTLNARVMTSEVIAQRMNERKLTGLRFYHPEMHGALFTLPVFVKELTDGPLVSLAHARRAA